MSHTVTISRPIRDCFSKGDRRVSSERLQCRRCSKKIILVRERKEEHLRTCSRI